MPTPAKRVPDRDARVRVRGRIDQDEIGLFIPRSLDAVDERAFVVALERRQRGARFLCPRGERLIDLCERHAAVHLRFPGAEKVQVGAVQHQQSCHGRFYFCGIARTLALFREICLVSPNGRARGIRKNYRCASKVSANSREVAAIAIQIAGNVQRVLQGAQRASSVFFSSAGWICPSFVSRILPCSSITTVKAVRRPYFRNFGPDRHPHNR